MTDKVKSVEDYLMEMLNQKYARHVFQQVNTEYEKKSDKLDSFPEGEYNWMVRRAMEVHKELNKEGEHEEKAKD